MAAGPTARRPSRWGCRRGRSRSRCTGCARGTASCCGRQSPRRSPIRAGSRPSSAICFRCSARERVTFFDNCFISEVMGNIIEKEPTLVTDTYLCPECGAKLALAAVPEQLCPRCLMGMGRQTESLAQAIARHDAEVLDGLLDRTIDGKYRINRLLGRGGMGAVYLATHLGTERPVALKVLAPRLMEDEEM